MPGAFMKISRENPDLVKIVQNYLALYMKTQVRFKVAVDINSPKKHCCATLSVFILLRVTCSSTIDKELTVAFSLPKWLRERVTMLHYTYIVYLVYIRIHVS